MHYLTVSQLANALDVTPQGINKYLREQGLQSKAVKKGNKFLIDEKLAETIRNHFRPNDPDILKNLKQSETSAETIETSTETTETKTETIGNYKTAGQADIFKAQIEQLEIRLKEKDSQIEFLQEELKASREIQKELASQNQLLTSQNSILITKQLVGTTQEQETNESSEVINIQPQEQEENNNVAEPIKESKDEEIEQPKKQSFWERIFG